MGEGIAAEQPPPAFVRLYRGDAARERVRGGTGIALTIAKALRLWFTSQGFGTAAFRWPPVGCGQSRFVGDPVPGRQAQADLMMSGARTDEW